MRKVIKNKYLFERSGTSQAGRKSPLLADDYFLVDGRSSADLIKFVLNFADQVVYYNTDNKPEGTFRTVLEGDDTIDIILMSAFDVQSLETQFKVLMKKFHENTALDEFTDFFNKIFYKILDWSNSFSDSPSLKNELLRLIDSGVTKAFVTYKSFCEEEEINHEKLSLFPLTWMQVKPITFDHQDKGQFLNRLMGLLVNVLDEFVREGKVFLNKRLEDYQKINPHIALLLTYFDLYREAQKEINQLTARNLKNYYENILKIPRKKIIPDKVYLFPLVAQNKNKVLIPKHTRFPAGNDHQGNPISYVSEREFIVSKAEVNTLKAVCRDNAQVTNTNNAAIDFYHIPDRMHPGKRLQENFQEPLGWCIGHTVLSLEEGLRKIRFIFTLERFSMHLLKKRLFNLGKNVDQEELLLHALELSFSNPMGWLKPDAENVETRIITDEDGVDKLIAEMLLSETDPAIAPFGDHPEGKVFGNKSPLVKLQITGKNSSFTNIFHDLTFIHLSIEVDVLGIKNLELQNDYGKLDATMPFMPFGPNPFIGSSFLVGHKTVFTHPLKELYVNIDWYDVPDLDHGFAEHYKGYSYIDSNQAFKSKLSVLDDKVWVPDEDKQIVDLFEDVEMEEEPELSPVNNFRGIDNIETEKIRLKSKDPDGFNVQVQKAKSGWFKMEICSPPNGFGNKEYTQLVKESISEGVKSKKIVLPPNEPWVPQMKSISIDYSTSVDFEFADGLANSFYHLYPFGQKRIRLSRKKQVSLLPHLMEGSELMIGLKHINPPQIFNLFFKLSDYISDYLPEDQNYTWYVMNGKKWELIEANQIVEDETKGFIQSGYISFDINKDIDLETGGILDNRLLWLKLSVKTSINFLKNILDIRSEAILARFETGAQKPTGQIEANSISSPEKFISGITEIRQPYASFGGRGSESYEKYVIRVSERLRHKNRVITYWDYEHIILEEFTEVNRVKCLPNTDADLTTRPGSALNVVVANVQQLNTNSHIPAFSKNYLEQIKRYLELKSSPFARIEVINPKYEEIKLKFNVKFNKGLNYRHYAEVLQREIILFLNPWLDQSSTQLDFGLSLRGASIVYFIEKQPYVNVITNLIVLQSLDGKTIPRDLTKNENIILQPSTPISIFISSEKHIINVINDEVEESGGLEDMSLGNDFIVETRDGSLENVSEGIEAYTLGVNFALPEDEQDTETKEDCFLIFNKHNHG